LLAGRLATGRFASSLLGTGHMCVLFLCDCNFPSVPPTLVGVT
jgi:hypothetical protein